ncbi:hypothetical protein EUTSA_v10027407mg [Eutrema salsugineum]|uniref:Ubiquitin-like protease family profile domain-containing protein n=1 Tax=Eutrema salsugineum TaxID=72664 RepID=V4LZW1_EUTSA|nr:hypothetical protein EUTSA_v10027407mg [Eutrema salsugineum]
MYGIMYLFREYTSLDRFPHPRVGFMTCNFSVTVGAAYKQLLMNKRRYQVDQLLIQYGLGALPAHGRTDKIWGVDVDRIYTLVNVKNNHWISLCINFELRTVDVFYCDGGKHSRYVDAFANIIPRVVKEVQSYKEKKQLIIKPYTVKYVPMRPGINRSSCDCGAYALKFIECHMLGLQLSLLNDDNIYAARMKITYDLWKAAHDPVLIERMRKYVPPKTVCSDDIVDLL